MTLIGRRVSTQKAVGRTLLALAVVMLLATSWLGVLLVQQTRILRTSVDSTQQAVDANFRTLGQAQRELLRLRALLITTPVDPAAVGVVTAFVDQRVQEGSLPYQGQTLGSEQLMQQSVELADQWRSTVRPQLEAALAGGNPAQFTDVAARLVDLEQSYNQLVSDSEINRKVRAAQANERTRQLLAQTDTLMLGLAVTAVAFVVFLAVAGYSSRRSRKQREKAAAELVALNAELRTHALVVHATDNLVVITDEAGRIEWVNDAFVRTTGYPLDVARGRRPGELLQGPDTDPDTIAMMSEALRRGEGFVAEVLNYAASGRQYWVHIDAHPVRDDNGKVNRYVAIEADVTERRLIDRQLREATDTALSLAEEKSAFLATMSHEIRTPLNAVLGVTALLQGTSLNTEQREYVDTAQRSGSLLLALVNDVLDFSALDSGRVAIEARRFTIRDVMDDVRSLFATTAAGRGLKLDVRVADDIPATVKGDEGRIRQVLVNLVGNALKFTDQGGVWVRVDRADDGSAVRFTIRDTGIGIAKDRQDRIFLPFTQVDASTTRRYGGTGLGLSICRLIADHLGATLELDSDAGAGSTFTFTVPMGLSEPKQDQPAPAKSPAADGAQIQHLRVLLAEDDPTNRMVAMRMLSRLGVTADVATDGLEAAEAVSKKDFDVVLMDVHMPRLDGVAATARIHEEASPERVMPKIVAVTANALEGDCERLIAAGMDGYLSKPITLSAIGSLLSAVAAGDDLPGPRASAVGSVKTSMV
jgi:hypothetical protein